VGKDKKSDTIQEAVDAIDDRIEAIEAKMQKYDRLKEEREKLRAARRALMGGNRLTGAGGNRIRQEDILEFLRKQPGSKVSEIAEGVGGTISQISSHLTRGKDERFLNHDQRWWVRDPKNGLNTAKDVKKLTRENEEEDE
jgi:phosphomevalonate kinase